MQNLVEIHHFVYSTLNRNEILTLIKGHNSVINLRKPQCNNPNQEFADVNAYAKFCHISSIHSHDIAQERISDFIQGTSRAISLLQIDNN